MLNDYIISHPEFPIKDYLPVLNHIAEEESRLVADFISHSPDLDTFWVISPQGIK
jgi:hypothetical protein